MAAVSLLTRKYNQYYAARPVLTTMITNAVCACLFLLQSLHAHCQPCVARGLGITPRDTHCTHAENLHKHYVKGDANN